MQFHKKHGVFEACKKVCKDFFDTLRGSRRSLSSGSAAAAAAAVVVVIVAAAIAAAAEDDYEDKDDPDAAVVVIAEHKMTFLRAKNSVVCVRRGGLMTR